MEQTQPAIIHVCQRCGRKIKLTDLHRKYNLYVNNLDRLMVSSRVRINEIGMGTPNIKRSGAFCLDGFGGYGMQNSLNQSGFNSGGFGHMIS